MKRILIFVAIFIVLVAGFVFLSNKKNETAETKSNPYEISLKQINSNLKDGSLLIDVRTAKEYKADHAVGAVNIPIEDIQKGTYPDIDKDKIIYVYCRSGRRATQAETILEKEGYKNVINLKSLYGWVALNGKTEGSNPTCSLESKSSC